MQRRTFLRTAASAVAAGRVINAAGPASAGQFTGKIRKAVKYPMINEPALSPADKLRLLKDLGFDGVEARTELEAGGEQAIRQLAAASEKVGLPVHGVVNGSNPDLVGAIEQAKMLGADSVLHVVRYKKTISYLQNYRETQEIIRRACDAAAKHGVMILLENVWATFLIEPLTMARYIDQLDSPMVGAYFDVGNVVRWGWPQHWIEVLGDRIKKLDIKEYDLKVAMNEGMRAGFGMPLGEGSVDWKAVRRELDRIGYTGWATAEVPGGDRERLADIAAQMDRALDLT